jgi:hypothetical protein
MLATDWYLEALIAQRKADVKVELRDIKQSGFSGSILTRGDFTDSGFQLDKTAVVEFSHRQARGYSRLNLYFNLTTFPRFSKETLIPVFSVQRIHPPFIMFKEITQQMCKIFHNILGSP